MSDKEIGDLKIADALEGEELVHIVQSGNSRKTTTGEIAARAMPVGSIMAFAASIAPAGWLECNGAAVSRTSFPHLFSKVHTMFGAGDEKTTFNIPDLRGEFVRGWDNGRGVDTDREFGSAQGEEIGPHDHKLSQLQYNNRNGNGGSNQNAEYNANGTTIMTISTDENSGIENRPRNIALLFCIKAFDAVADPAQVSAAAVVADVASVTGRVDALETANPGITESEELSFATSGQIAWLHGFGVVPKRWRAVLRCKAADAGGYEVGDELPITQNAVAASNNYAYATGASDTELWFTYRATNVLIFPYKASTSVYTLDPADWALVFQVWE